MTGVHRLSQPLPKPIYDAGRVLLGRVGGGPGAAGAATSAEVLLGKDCNDLDRVENSFINANWVFIV